MNRDTRAAQPPAKTEKPDPRGDFLRAVAGTLRAIGRTNAVVATEGRPPSAPADGSKPPLHIPPDIIKTYPVEHFIRGATDAMGFHLRHSNEKTHKRLRPQEPAPARLFDALEQARCDMLGGRDYAGSLKNMTHYVAYEIARCEQQGKGGEVGLQSAMVRLLALKAQGAAMSDTMHAALDGWLTKMGGRVTDADFETLRDSAHSQKRFARYAYALMNKLGYPVEMPPPPPNDKKKSDKKDEQDNKKKQTGEDQDKGENDSKDDKSKDKPQKSDGEMTAAQASEPYDDDDYEEEDDGPGEGGYEAEIKDSAGGQRLPPPRIPKPPEPTEKNKSNYKVFTREFDEEIKAEKLAPANLLDQLYDILQKAINEQSSAISRLAQKMQRRLMGRQQRDWHFNLEEGMLDPARLTGVIMDPFASLSFKQEADRAFKDTVVTLLLDNSGSMRGQPIKTTAIAASIIGTALERCGIKFEILGYTTKAWKGGRAREQWVNAGKPDNPGRLNELRHVIYKSADTPMRRARKNLAAMLMESLLRENIDGEALQWAAARLEKRTEERKILIVISDGAPVDDETLKANNGLYLANHLKEVIAGIQQQKRIELIGLGIGHDTKEYYARAKKLENASTIAEELISQLDDLFDTPDLQGRRHGPRRGPKGPGL